jgi:mannose-1-phosphate guanylyltransferase
MIRRTVARLSPFFDAARVHVICGMAHAEAIRRELPLLPPQNVIAEPVGRDTAAAIGLAAYLLERRDPGCSFAVLPADHHIESVERFQGALRTAFEAARDGSLITFGIRPRFPSTAYGYLERGDREGSAFRVRRFCEKPDEARASEFVASGRHFWNSGMFVWRADAILREIERHLPQHHAVLRESTRLSEAYAQLQKVSIDYGVMEKAERVLMIEADFEWDDVGSWNAVAARRAKDAAGNAIDALAVAPETKDSLIVSSDPRHLVAALGVEDLIIVHTPEATLVCPRSRAEDLKKLIETIHARGLERFL